MDITLLFSFGAYMRARILALERFFDIPLPSGSMRTSVNMDTNPGLGCPTITYSNKN